MEKNESILPNPNNYVPQIAVKKRRPLHQWKRAVAALEEQGEDEKTKKLWIDFIDKYSYLLK